MSRSRYLRFLFSETDQQRIDPSSIRVEDVPYSATPRKGEPYPQSMKLSFKINDPQNGAPEIWPLFPGKLSFIADNATNGILPSASEVRLESAAYENWKKEGMICISRSENFSTLKSIKETFTEHNVIFPNLIWYAPIVLPKDFVLHSLIARLGNAPLTGTKLQTAKKMISTFLNTGSAMQLSVKQNPDNDTVAQLTMPTVKMKADGYVELFISTALENNPFDEYDAVFDPGVAGVERDKARLDPVHPRNGAIPARLVYRELKQKMVESPGVVADVVFEGWPLAIGYAPFRFTRTWKPVEECSIHFPKQILKIARGSESDPNPITQRLPAHGVFYLMLRPEEEATDPLYVTLSNPPNDPPDDPLDEHEMFWLDGATPDAWKQPAAKTALEFILTDVELPEFPDLNDENDVKRPHIILRRSMGREVLADIPSRKKSLPKSHRLLNSCTYYSLHRVIRALVDHRITGGRMYGCSRWSTMKSLISEALGNSFSNIFVAGRKYAPNTALTDEAGVRDESVRIYNFLKTFFSDDARSYDGFASVNNFKMGGAAYWVWQSNIEQFQDLNRKYFSDEHMGHGGAGALKVIGMGSYSIERNDGETNQAWKNRITANVRTMIKGIKPGAVLQFWRDPADFVRMKNRGFQKDCIKADENGDPVHIYCGPFGHSPIFVKHIGDKNNPDGIEIIDQSGEVTRCRIISGILNWGNYAEPRIWIAANWNE